MTRSFYSWGGSWREKMMDFCFYVPRVSTQVRLITKSQSNVATFNISAVGVELIHRFLAIVAPVQIVYLQKYPIQVPDWARWNFSICEKWHVTCWLEFNWFDMLLADIRVWSHGESFEAAMPHGSKMPWRRCVPLLGVWWHSYCTCFSTKMIDNLERQGSGGSVCLTVGVTNVYITAVMCVSSTASVASLSCSAFGKFLITSSP